MVTPYFINIRATLIDFLEKAKLDIKVAMYWFTNLELFEKLCQKLQEGVKVELIVFNDYVNNRLEGLNFQRFIDLGGKFYFSNNDNPIHHKFCIIDNEVLINGSYNWTYFAENKNRENIVVLTNDKNTIDAFVDEFRRLKLNLKLIDIINYFSIDKFATNDMLSNKDYLANDLIYQALDTKNYFFAKMAFELAPENIDIQKIAVDNSLVQIIQLTNSISVGIKGGKYLLGVPKGATLPLKITKDLTTSEDNQTTCATLIHVGAAHVPLPPFKSKNGYSSGVCLYNLPAKPKGVVKMKVEFSVDINRQLIVKFFCLENLCEDIYNLDISFMTEIV